MILYSIIPAEVVFHGSSHLDRNEFIETVYRGEKVLVLKREDKQYEIARLISTNPATFLNPVYKPGTIIDTSELKLSKA